MHKLLTPVLLLNLLVLGCHEESNSKILSSTKACKISVACKQELPTLDKASGFSSFYKSALSKLGSPLHRGRDMIVRSGETVVIQAKFTYGILDSDLKEEPIDIYYSEDCNAPLHKIGQTLTTTEGQHESVDGVEDTGGRIYANLSDFGLNSLPIGRHRVVLVVPADNSSTELYIDVIRDESPAVVSDIDGTLTESELAAAGQLVGISPKAHPGAADALNALHAKGYHIIYLTGRAEWFMDKTREWLAANKFPPGTIRTTQSKKGFNGAQAAAYKAEELSQFKIANGLSLSYAFGNKDSDVEAYGEAGIPPEHSFYFKLAGDTKGGNLVSDYRELLPELSLAESTCH